MSICNNPYAILPIGIRECIGISLNTINAYWNLIQSESCEQENEINALTTEILTLSSRFYTLSSEFEGVAKAYVTFSGVLSNNAQDMVIYNSFNVSEIEIEQPGIYTVKLSTPLLSAGGIATCSKITSNSYSGWANVDIINSTTAQITIANRDGIITNQRPGVVAVSFYSP